MLISQPFKLRKIYLLLVHCLSNCNCYGYGHTNHWVVAGTDKTHHINMGRYRRRTSELCIRMHTTESISHTIGSRTCCHVIRMQSTTSTTTGSYGEVLLAKLDALLLVGTSYRMLEAGRVGGVAGDGNINLLQMHDSYTLWNRVSTIALNLGARTIRIRNLFYNVNLASLVIILGLNIGKAVDTGNNLGSVLAKTVQDNPERVLTNLVGSLSNTDSTLSSCKGLMTSQECEALSILSEEHGSQITMAQAYLTMVSNGARNTECLNTFTDSLGSISSSLYALLDCNSGTKSVSPLCVLEADWLQIRNDGSRVKALFLTDISGSFNGSNTVLLANFIYAVNAALIAFK